MDESNNQNNLTTSESLKRALLRNAKWANILAIVTIAFNGINLLRGLIQFVQLLKLGINGAYMLLQGVTLLIFAAIIAVNILLLKYGSKIKAAANNLEEDKIEDGINCMTNYFKAYIITMIISVVSIIMGIILFFNLS